MEKAYQRLQYIFMIAAIVVVAYAAIVAYGILKIIY